MEKKIIGVLGGMGPAAGIYFTEQMIALTSAAKCDQDHVPFILYSDPSVPHRSNAYMTAAESPVPNIVRGIHMLEKAGASFGVMICNTAHIFFKDIEKEVSLPLVNMVNNTADWLRPNHSGIKIGLLATEATVHSGLYKHCFDDLDIEVVVPIESDQALISDAIYSPVHGIKATGMLPSAETLKEIAEVAERMRERNGIAHLLLGCTELSLAIPDHFWHGFEIIDPLKLLAQTCLHRVQN